jgi:nitroimidazol reductase NimA-like FMN-containing flavoprotein (pyridoxamine 5'-phosphate oxidase superfamily)
MPAKNAAKSREPRASRPEIPGYGLPKTRKGLLPWRWALDRLGKSQQYWVATVRPDGRPHVMPVWGLWLDGTFCFSTGSKSRKARNLGKNSHCVVCNENSAEAVVVEGTAKPLRDVSVIRSFLRLYERKYKYDMSGMAQGMLELKEPVFAVHPHTAFGLYEKKFAETATRWQFGASSARRKKNS